MRFPDPLLPGRLVRRYKRFLADVELDDGTAVVASPGHRSNLLSPEFDESGIGVAINEDGAIYFTQVSSSSDRQPKPST